MARRSPLVRAALEAAVAEGHFAHVAGVLGGTDEVTFHVPIEVRLPDGARTRATRHAYLVRTGRSTPRALHRFRAIPVLIALDAHTQVR